MSGSCLKPVDDAWISQRYSFDYSHRSSTEYLHVPVQLLSTHAQGRRHTELHALHVEARRLSNDDCVPEAFHQRPSCLYGTYPSSRQQQQREHSPAPHSHYTQSIAANMADKMEVDAVVADKQVEASGPAPEKAPERSTYNRAAIALHDQEYACKVRQTHNGEELTVDGPNR